MLFVTLYIVVVRLLKTTQEPKKMGGWVIIGDIFDKEKLLRAGFCIGIRAALSTIIVILLLKVHAGQSCPAVVIVEKNSLCIAA